MSTDPSLTDRAQAAADLLEEIVADRGLLAGLEADLMKRLLIAAGRASHPTKGEVRSLRKAKRKREKEARRRADEALLDRTSIRKARAQAVFATPSNDAPRELAPPEEPIELNAPRSCYVCKTKFTTLHAFYDSMCGPCGDLNYASAPRRRTCLAAPPC